MSSPITWRNVTGPSNTDVFRGMDSAGKSITGGFDMMGKVISDRQAVNQGVEDRAGEANVLSFKEALANARTPEEVAALQGQLGQMRAGMNNKGRTAVLGAEDARTASLMQQIGARTTFDNQQRDQAQAPAMEALGVAAQNQDKSGFDAIVAANPGLAHLSKAYEQMRTVGNAVQTQGFAVNRDQRETAKVATDAQHNRDSLVLDGRRIANSEAQTTIQAKTANSNIAARLEKELADSETRRAAPNKQLASSAEGWAYVSKALKEGAGKDDDLFQARLDMAAAAMKKPENAGLPAYLLVQNVQGQDAPGWFSDGSAKLEKSLALGRDAYAGTAVERQTQNDAAIEHEQVIRAAIRQANGLPAKADVPVSAPAPQAGVNRLDRASQAADKAEQAAVVAAMDAARAAAVKPVPKAPAPVAKNDPIEVAGAQVDQARAAVRTLMQHVPGLAAGRPAINAFATKIEAARQLAVQRQAEYEKLLPAQGAAFGSRVKM